MDQMSNLCNKTHLYLICCVIIFLKKLWGASTKFKIILEKCFSHIVTILGVIIPMLGLKKEKKEDPKSS